MNTLFTLAVLASITCPRLTLINQTDTDWIEEDYKWAFENEKNCMQYPDMPCTLAIIKTPAAYILRCGPQMEIPKK